ACSGAKADPGKQITCNIRYVRRELDISFRDRYPFNDDFVTKNTIPRSIKKTSNSRVLIEAYLIRKSLDHKEILKGGYNMRANKPKTKILIDGGDPDETLRIKKLIGFVDGQTTNPSLIAKNPEVQQLLAAGHRLTTEEQKDEYKRIVQKISPLVGMRAFQSKSLLIWTQRPSGCSLRDKKCSPGLRTLTSSIPALMKACEPRMYQWSEVSASI